MKFVFIEFIDDCEIDNLISRVQKIMEISGVEFVEWIENPIVRTDTKEPIGASAHKITFTGSPLKIWKAKSFVKSTHQEEPNKQLKDKILKDMGL